MPDGLVLLDRSERIATLTLNNPPVNAVSLKLIEELHAQLDAIEADREIRCVILTGAGEKAFCAGADLREEGRFKDPAAGKRFRELGRKTLGRLEGFPKPVISAIHGYCIGGGTALGWVCDIRIAADNAVFRAGDAHLGIVPSWGMGLLRLPRLIGRNHALDLLLTGENFDATKACALGLVTKVVPKAALMEEARKVARRIAEASPNAIRAIRRSVHYNLRHSWDEMIAFEEEICADVFGHPDAVEGPKAFTEKRKPSFQDS